MKNREVNAKGRQEERYKSRKARDDDNHELRMAPAFAVRCAGSS